MGRRVTVNGGQGGFAKCYLFTDADSGKKWACKIVAKSSLTKNRHKEKVRCDRCRGGADVGQLQSEIKIHKMLHHPNIVHLEEVFEDNENVYLVLELCEYQVRTPLRLPLLTPVCRRCWSWSSASTGCWTTTRGISCTSLCLR